MESLVQTLANLFAGLDIRGRWLAFIAFVFLLLASLFMFEYITGYNYYSNLDKKVSLLKELNDLAKDNIASRPDLYEPYKQTLQELEEREIIHSLSLLRGLLIHWNLSSTRFGFWFERKKC